MKKLLATLLAVMMIATLCVVYVSAADEWTKHTIFDGELIGADGEPIDEAVITDNNAVNGFQFWIGRGHLFQSNGLNICENAKVVISFKGTGFKLPVQFRQMEASAPAKENVSITIDGVEKGDLLKDYTVAAFDGSHVVETVIFEVTGLAAGEHEAVISCSADSSKRFEVDAYSVLNEGAEPPKYDTKLKAVVIFPAAEDYTRLDGSPAYWTRFIFTRNWSEQGEGYDCIWKLKIGDKTWNCDNDEKVLNASGEEVDLNWGYYKWGVDEKGNYYFEQLFNPTSEMLGEDDLYELAKQGKLEAFMGDHIGGVAGVIDTNPKATFLCNGNYEGVDVAMVTVKTSEDYYSASKTGDSLLAVVAVVVAASAGVVLVKKH